jgi:CubicO group peptidase (beta-lactamase class C family)
VTGSVPAKNTLTIRMVMNHTGGFAFEIPTKSKKGWPALSLRDTAKEAASIPLQFEPGTAVRYSNTGIDIGAAIIEVVTGKPWDVFLKERVLDPLGMSNTTFNPTDEQLARAITMYSVKPGEKAKFRAFHPSMPLPHNGKDIHPSAGAGLWTCASDQIKFYKMLMNNGIGDNGVRILKAETVKNLLATSTRPGNLGHYSLGLSINATNGFFGHGGAWGTSCLVNPEKKQVIFWVVQLTGNQKQQCRKSGENNGAANNSAEILKLLRAEFSRHQNTKALGNTLNHTENHPVEPVGCAQCSKGIYAQRLAHHHGIHHGIKLLEDVTHHHRKGEPDDQPRRGAFCHIKSSGSHGSSFRL